MEAALATNVTAAENANSAAEPEWWESAPRLVSSAAAARAVTFATVQGNVSPVEEVAICRFSASGGNTPPTESRGKESMTRKPSSESR